ncbi:FtsQ-type POTRA domain-containing protein [Orbaceae bacterium ESL0727]|nr:FtsQ-type POTRA domain-containing protein [Orbaceae bacterium ESL0727]
MKKIRQAAHRKKKEKQKRKLFLFRNAEQAFGFIFFILVIYASVWVVQSVKAWMDDPERVVLSQLTLSGEHVFTTEDDIRKAILGLGLPNTYIAQDVDNIQQEVLRLPWVKQASIRKQWPDRLLVHVVEYVPAFYWNDLFLLDKDGEMFSVPLDRIINLQLPQLYGPEGKQKMVLDEYRKLDNLSKQLATSQLMLHIKAAIADERSAWQLFVKQCVANFCIDNQDIKLVLGSEDIEQRYQRFIKLFPEIQARISDSERIVVADLRYENGISVQREKIVQ